MSLNAGNTGDVLEPVIALDSGGNGLAVWQQVDSSNIGLVLRADAATCRCRSWKRSGPGGRRW